MAKTKRVSYKGIPAKERARVAKILRMQRDGIDFLNDKPQSPQEVWASLNENWARQQEEVEKKAKQEAKSRAARIRTFAVEALYPALIKLQSARDLVHLIARGEDTYFEPDTWAMFTRMAITEAGQELEQALCNLGLIEENDTGGRFVEHQLKRLGAEMPAQEAK